LNGVDNPQLIYLESLEGNIPLRPISKSEALNFEDVLDHEDQTSLISLSLNNNHPLSHQWSSEDIEGLSVWVYGELLEKIHYISGFNISQFSIDALLRTDEARNIVWLDYSGYHLASCQGDLTVPQHYFIVKGRLDLHKEMNEVKK
jgi:hypothetical protein